MCEKEIDDETVLRVHIDNKDRVAYYLLYEGNYAEE